MARADAVRAWLWLAALFELAAPAARADQLPKWEAGVGLSALRFPDYRGSDQDRYFLLPFPYLIYRGDVLKLDRDGARARLLGTDRIEFDLSAGGSVPVRSTSNVARNGMPDLQPTVEFGPVTQFHLWRDGDEKVDLRVPVRRAFTVGRAGVGDAGTVAEVQLNVDRRLHFGSGDGNLGLLAAAQFGDRRQNDYFYAVAPPYATPQRPAYTAHGGYAGWHAIGALSRRAGPWWIAAFVRYDDLKGAVFADSPLVLRHAQFAGGFALAWVFATSRERVEAQQ